MGILADRLDAMRVWITSPDGMIAAELRDRVEVDLSFGRGAYRQYSEPALAAQLTAVGRLLWAGRVKTFHATLSDVFGATMTGDSCPLGHRDVSFHEERDQLVAHGWSGDRRVEVTVRGMSGWTVHIQSGTLRILAEDEFVDRCREAGRELIEDQFQAVRRLQQQIYEEPAYLSRSRYR